MNCKHHRPTWHTSCPTCRPKVAQTQSRPAPRGPFLLENDLAIRMPFPAGVCADPDAKYRRTLAEAFPSDARQAVAMQSFPTKKDTARWLISAVLVLLISLVLSGCSGAEAQEVPVSPQELRRAAAAAFYCPGMTAVWLDESTVQCLKETP